MLILICLGYINPAFATCHQSFLVKGEDLQELSYYDHVLETPNFFAYVYPLNINPNLVIVPRINSGFAFGVSGYLQRAFDNQLDWVIADPSQTFSYVPDINSTIQSIDPDYQFAFGAYLAYTHPYSGRDVRFEFYDFSSNNNDSASPPTTSGVLWTPNTLYDRTAVALAPSAAKANIDVLQASLMTGQQIAAGARFRLHPSFGLKYASINRELSSSFNMAATILRPFLGNSFVSEKSNFNGLGPAFQIDSTYFFSPHFGVIGHLTNAILLGSINSKNSYSEELLVPSGENFVSANTEINLKATDRAVANVDGKLGFFFDYPFCGTLTKLDIEIGYEFNHFFNAIDTYRSAGGVLIAGGTAEVPIRVYADTPNHIKVPHDLSIDGPYFSIGLSGIACPSNTVLDPVCVTVPRLKGGFVFTYGINYYRVQQIQRDYALVDPTPLLVTEPPLVPALFVPSTNATLQNNEGDNAYGIELQLAYIFQHSPYDMTVHYEQSQANDHDMVDPKRNSVVWPILSIPYFATYESRIFARDANAHLSFNYNEAHVDFGQAINAAGFVWFRLFEGIEYARIQSNFHVNYGRLTSLPLIGVLPLDFHEEQIKQDSDFHGIGPRLGIDMNLPVGGFSLASELAGGFLLGSIDSSYKDTISVGTIGVPGGELIVLPETRLGTNLASENQLSPFLEMKLGLAYNWDFFGGTHWNLELGYKAVHYFNSLATFRHVTNNAAVFVKQINDVTLDGPFINISVFGFGGCPDDCIVRSPYCVYVPELRGGFEFALEGLYLQTEVSNTDYAIVDPRPAIIPPLETIPPFAQGIELNPSDRSVMQVVSPGSNTGYRFHLGYIFPLTANDIGINYLNYSNSSSEEVNAPSGGVIWTITNGNFGAQAIFEPSFFPVIASSAQANTEFKWQTGNFELGRRIKFYNLMTRFFAGLAYARVDENIDIQYSNGIANNAAHTPIGSDLITQESNFKGLGPRLGVGADFNFECGFSLVGSVATDLLIGTIDSGFFEYSSSGESAVLNPDERTRLVPAVDGKFGLAYSIPLMNCSQISLEVGYQVNHYFNVKDSLRFTDYASAFAKENQDISFNGPYVRMQFEF